MEKKILPVFILLLLAGVTVPDAVTNAQTSAEVVTIRLDEQALPPSQIEFLKTLPPSIIGTLQQTLIPLGSFQTTQDTSSSTPTSPQNSENITPSTSSGYSPSASDAAIVSSSEYLHPSPTISPTPTTLPTPIKTKLKKQDRVEKNSTPVVASSSASTTQAFTRTAFPIYAPASMNIYDVSKQFTPALTRLLLEFALLCGISGIILLRDRIWRTAATYLWR